MLHLLLWLMYLLGFDRSDTTVEPLRPPVHASRSHTRQPLDKFYRLSVCETGHVNKPNPSGKYRGYFQFDYQTWNSVGGTGDPLDSTYEEQKFFAEKLQADRGWSPWPQCARKLGYI